MIFFPAEDDKCEDESYLTPDVSMTALPSEIFGEAMDNYIEEDAWRGGTPTLYVMNGLLSFIAASAEENPGKYVIVLVTDGYPQSCKDNEISSVVDAAAAGLEDGVMTYVIGVNNPDIEGAPDTVSNLGEIAAGGGTQNAFIIDTGDAQQTAEDFSSAVKEIRSASFSCTLTIPDPPDDREFDKQKVKVTYVSGTKENDLTYDPSCTGENTWRYDDADAPAQIVLCDDTCEAIQNDRDASLEVEFSCVNTIIII